MRAPAFLLAVLLFSVAPMSLAEEPPAMSDRDREFVQIAMDSNARELQLSMRAREKARSDTVREFAVTMIDEHGRKGEELAQFSRRMNAAGGPPHKRQDRSVRAMMNELDHLEGASFDRGYMEAMVNDHKKAVRLYEREARGARDAQLKEFAQATLPALRRHLQMALTIVAELK